jgi:hypothetical protein
VYPTCSVRSNDSATYHGEIEDVPLFKSSHRLMLASRPSSGLLDAEPDPFARSSNEHDGTSWKRAADEQSFWALLVIMYRTLGAIHSQDNPPVGSPARGLLTHSAFSRTNSSMLLPLGEHFRLGTAYGVAASGMYFGARRLLTTRIAGSWARCWASLASS